MSLRVDINKTIINKTITKTQGNKETRKQGTTKTLREKIVMENSKKQR